MESKDLKQRYVELYDYMATSKEPANMKHFGNIMTEMFHWFADNKPEKAEEWLWKLEAIKWNNYLTPKEADTIVAQMVPAAPWTREQWQKAMADHDFDMEDTPYYNKCALYVTMNMIYSDSIETLKKYVGASELFNAIYDLAVDKLVDEDGQFNIREYFNL